MQMIDTKFEKFKWINLSLILLAVVFIVIGAVIVLIPSHLTAQEQVQTGSATQTSNNAPGLAYIAAGLTVGLSVLGAGFSLSKIGSAAVAAISEKPEVMGRAIVFAGLAEGLSIWGLIVAVLILGKV